VTDKSRSVFSDNAVSREQLKRGAIPVLKIGMELKKSRLRAGGGGSFEILHTV
jgi:hypothetical protein